MNSYPKGDIHDILERYGEIAVAMVKHSDPSEGIVMMGIPTVALSDSYFKIRSRAMTSEQISTLYPDGIFYVELAGDGPLLVVDLTETEALMTFLAWCTIHYPILSFYLSPKLASETDQRGCQKGYQHLVIKSCEEEYEKVKKSVGLRMIGRPDLLQVYPVPVLRGEIGDATLTLLNDMKISGRRMATFGPVDLMDSCFSVEENAIIKILLEEEGPCFEIKDLISICCNPRLNGSLFAILEAYEQASERRQDTYDLTGCLNPYRGLSIIEAGAKDFSTVQDVSIKKEFRSIVDQQEITEESPFIFKANNRFHALTRATDEDLDRALNYAVGGWLELLQSEVREKAYFTGSIVSAVVSYFAQDGCHSFSDWLDVLYPSVYTRMKNQENSDVVVYRCMMIYGSSEAGFALDVESHYNPSGNDLEVVLRRIGNNSERSYDPNIVDVLIGIPANRYCRHINVDEPDEATFNFELVPGVDVDIAIETQDSQELTSSAEMIFESVKQLWPSAVLERKDKSNGHFMFTVRSVNIEDYIEGFRNVEIYMNDRRGIVTHHLAPVRMWKGPLPGIYASASAMKALVNQEMEEFHYFAGKSRPWDTIIKYMQRGYTLEGPLRKLIHGRYNTVAELSIVRDLVNLGRIRSRFSSNATIRDGIINVNPALIGYGGYNLLYILTTFTNEGSLPRKGQRFADEEDEISVSHFRRNLYGDRLRYYLSSRKVIEKSQRPNNIDPAETFAEIFNQINLEEGNRLITAEDVEVGDFEQEFDQNRTLEYEDLVENGSELGSRAVRLTDRIFYGPYYQGITEIIADISSQSSQ